MINGIHQYSTESLIKELEKRGYDCDDLEKIPSGELSDEERAMFERIMDGFQEVVTFDMEKAKESFSNTDYLDITQNFKVTEDWFKK